MPEPSASESGRDLLLIGGGHSHVAVIKRLARDSPPRTRITLVSRGWATPYSGMLPGLVAGHYTFEDAHIDLRRLCRYARIRFINDTVTGLDPETRRVHCATGLSLPFHLVSIDTGSTPDTAGVPGAGEHSLPVKPIDQFLSRWEELERKVAAAPEAPPFTVAIVGGGAAGVELCLSLQHRLALAQKQNTPRQFRPVHFAILNSTPTILPTHNRRVQKIFTRLLQQRQVTVHAERRVTEVEPNRVHCDNGAVLNADLVIWAVHAAPAPWIAAAGLDTAPGGFLLVNEYFQSTSHPFVFGAGDAATSRSHPRPKSGVFAVRQGPPLSTNLQRSLAGRPLQAFVPQKEFLSLISTGNCCAVASRGRFACQGAWVWRWKDWIDRRWMRQYQELDGPAPASGR